MRRLLYIVLCVVMLASCTGRGNGNKSAAADVAKSESSVNDQSNAAVEVLYFHGNRRCATCIAIEQKTKELLDEQFADEMAQGKIVFKSINYDEPEGKDLAKQYMVAGSSLIISSAGGEAVDNLTNFAFTTARSRTDEFKEGVRTGIRKQIQSTPR
ncbi:MAG: nitrophenyl compound nitroreductase subunit ArsF family protein [Candidatus Cryptobacteroides sp.]